MLCAEARISRILLVRVDGIGDALQCAPLIAALRAAGHEVGALLSTRSAEAFAHGALRAVHVVERIPWPRHGVTPATRAHALSEVRTAGYDVALIASEEPDAYAFARDAGIPQRAGFVNGWEKPLKSLWTRRLLTKALVRPASAQRSRRHEAEVLFELGCGLVEETEPTDEVARLRPLVLDADPLPHGRVVLQIDAKYVGAGLTLAAFGAIAAAIRARGARPIAAGADEDLARIFAARSGVEFVRLDVPAWKATIASARAVIAPDSGAVHVAGMTGTPAVVLFPGARFVERDVARWRPWAAPYRALVTDGTTARAPGALEGAPLAEAVADALEAIAPAGVPA